MTYLDNAATTFPKPVRVAREVGRCMRRYGGNPGRGAHDLSLRAAGKVYECREALADLLGAPGPEEVVFTVNATAALNLAIKGIVKRGAHVLIGDMEHNAVRRPILKLEREGVITYDVFPTYPTLAPGDERDGKILDGIRRLVRAGTTLLIVSHASNICSATQPIRKIGQFCRERGIIFLVDAAQSAGHIPIDADDMKIDILCAPGHKGLYGPQGSGVLLFGRKGIGLRTLTEGGNGFESLRGDMSEKSPERYEAGTLPTPAIAGLCEGVRFVAARGAEVIGAHEAALFRYTRDRLAELPGVVLYAPRHEGAVLSFNRVGMPSGEVGRLLNREGICVRTGYHCSALGHTTLGTLSGGSVRVSFGAFNTKSDCDRLIRALSRIN